MGKFAGESGSRRSMSIVRQFVVAIVIPVSERGKDGWLDIDDYMKTAVVIGN